MRRAITSNLVSTRHDYVAPTTRTTSTVLAAVPESPPDAAERQRAGYLIRRLKLVLFDLGLARNIPTDWVVPTGDGLVFGLLTIKQADQLIRTLEDVVTGRPPTSSGPGPGQLSFFEGG